VKKEEWVGNLASIGTWKKKRNNWAKSILNLRKKQAMEEDWRNRKRICLGKKENDECSRKLGRNAGN
jgi:hypothetical protein